MIKEENIIEYNGFRFNYSIEGEGQDILVIGSAVYYPKTFSKEIKKKFRFIFIDHRGFAATGEYINTALLKLETIIDDIEYIRKVLNLGKVIIMGHSGHGYMALEYAKKYSENVSHIVLIGMGPDQGEKNMALAEKYFNQTASAEQKGLFTTNMQNLWAEIEADPERKFATLCIKLGPKTWYDYKYDASSLWEGTHLNTAIFDHLWGVVFRDIDIVKGLEDLRIPVFLALGKYDFLVAPYYAWDEIKDKFHNLTIHIFDKSGHNPQLEQSSEFDLQLTKWISIN